MLTFFNTTLPKYIKNIQFLSNFGVKDVVEIIVLSYIIYKMLVWVKRSRAWSLLKGFGVFLAFLLISKIFNLVELVYIMDKAIGVGITAFIILFQPELRKGLEHLGRSNIFSLENFKPAEEFLSDEQIKEIVRAVFIMAKHKTGALIVIEQRVDLSEIVRTGIPIDSVITSQLLINTFEKNTPLHDGAVVIRNGRIAAATCYLPVSESNTLSKDLGTRHRAALGASEISDSFTIIVSEETGAVSIAYLNNISRNLDEEGLKTRLVALQNKHDSSKKKSSKRRKANEQ